jgi:hypothetical protein
LYTATSAASTSYFGAHREGSRVKNLKRPNSVRFYDEETTPLDTLCVRLKRFHRRILLRGITLLVLQIKGLVTDKLPEEEKLETLLKQGKSPA